MSRQLPERASLTLHLDIYGDLITGRASQVLDLYINEDLSLGEIAQQLGISRQGVHDALRRGSSRLEAFERKLGIVARHQATRRQLSALERALEAGRSEDVDDALAALNGLYD